MPLEVASQVSSSGIHYISCGPQDTGPTLLCVHGWACRSADFLYVFDEFIKHDSDFRAIALDLPGHGSSSTEHYPTAGVDSFARAVLDLMDELSLEKIVLAGHSMGVRIVLETWQQAMSAERPQVQGLCFLDGSHYKFRKSLFAFDSGDARSASLTDEEKHEKMAEAFDRMLSSATPKDFREAAIDHVKAIDLQYSEDMRKSFIQYDYDRTDDVMENLGKADMPILSIQATDVDEENQRRMLQEGKDSRWMQFVCTKVPQAKMAVVPQSGHFPHVDRPQIVAAHLKDLMRSP
ncbi:uncharacterized protein LTR77_003670 [Saxophila tyrrhenica]|uniref:AB hydrolase-1 domain-containing protein n=1 Tax=Saxophila tyrrhenica TaxID=1690608 RepID=A0AAV9PGX6_9PEZI|nr:hypothetical protein LTR77_003670 [Saxophila tyrrhenica]